jgi:hypothetical protein
MVSTSGRQHNNHSRSYASTGSVNELLVPRPLRVKRWIARNPARVDASASAGISQDTSSVNRTTYTSSTKGVRFVVCWGRRRRGREKGMRVSSHDHQDKTVVEH